MRPLLESLRDSRQSVVLQDPSVIGLIAHHLKVEVATFHFDSVALVQVLSQIRSELFNKAQVLSDMPRKKPSAKNTKSEEIVMLKPNIHGIGVDLRALWRKATRDKNE